MIYYNEWTPATKVQNNNNNNNWREKNKQILQTTQISKNRDIHDQIQQQGKSPTK